MKPNVLIRAGSLGLMAGAILWSSPSQAQGYCYLVNSEGEVVNLDDLCESNDSQPVPSPEAAGVGEATTETQEGSSSGEVRTYTITGPAAVPGSSTAPAGSAAGQPGTTEASPEGTDATTPGATEESPETAPETTTDPTDASEAGTEPRTEENRLDIPVREIETPQIPTPQTQPPRVTTPEAQDPTADTPDVDTTDTPNSEPSDADQESDD